MRTIVYEVRPAGPHDPEVPASARWRLSRNSAVDGASELPTGNYEIVEHYAEGQSYADLVLSALVGNLRFGYVAGTVKVSELGDATFTAQVTKSIKKAPAKS